MQTLRKKLRVGHRPRIILILLAIMPLLAGCRKDVSPNTGGGIEYVQPPMIPSAAPATGSPNVPEYIVFAGDTIRFDRDDMYERMDRELIAFTYSHSLSVLMLKRAPKYLPQIEPILERCGIPDDFKYLMVIESNLDPRSYSSAGAAGLWQFTQATGKQYGLEINSNVDERYNIEKATVAACRYLRDAYDKYGDWLTVAASYNAGQNRITKEKARQRQNKATDLWLPAETSRYIFRILAAKMMFTAPEQFGFDVRPEQKYRPIPCSDTIVVTRPISDLAAFALRHGITYLELRTANPWLLEQQLKNQSRREYRIAIPDKTKNRSSR